MVINCHYNKYGHTRCYFVIFLDAKRRGSNDYEKDIKKRIKLLGSAEQTQPQGDWARLTHMILPCPRVTFSMMQIQFLNCELPQHFKIKDIPEIVQSEARWQPDYIPLIYLWRYIGAIEIIQAFHKECRE